MQELTDLKNLVIQALEANGSLAKIRAQIRASVFNVVDQQEGQPKKPSPFFWENNKAQSVYELQGGKEMLEVIKEFLQFYDMHYTLSIFQREDVNKEALAKKVGLESADNQRPILHSIINKQGGPRPSADKKVNQQQQPQQQQQQKESQPSPKELQKKHQEEQQLLLQQQQQQKLEKQKQDEEKQRLQQQRAEEERNKLEEARKKMEQEDQRRKQLQLEKEKEQQKKDEQLKKQQQQEQKKKEEDEKQRLQKQQQLVAEKEYEDEKFDEFNELEEEPMYEEDMRESQLKRQQQQEGEMFGSSDEYIQASQSQGFDMTVDSMALEEFDYYEDVEDIQ